MTKEEKDMFRDGYLIIAAAIIFSRMNRFDEFDNDHTEECLEKSVSLACDLRTVLR